MTLMRFLKYLFFFTFVLYGISTRAQTYGEWFGSSINFELPQKFTFKITGQGRIRNHSDGLYKYLAQYETGYKISKRFDAAFIYRTAWRKEEEGNFHYRDKMFAELNFDYPVSRFKIENRLRYQRGTKTYINSKKDLIPKHYIRDRFELKYDIKNCKITPFVFCELFFPLYHRSSNTIDEYRLGWEIRYKVNENQSFKTGMDYHNDRTVFPLSTILFRFTYSFNIQLFS